MRILFSFICTTLLVSMPLIAYATGPENEREWKARAELSYVGTAGNTDTETLSGKMEVKREGVLNRYLLTGKALRTKEGGAVTSEKLSIDVGWERVFTKRFFISLSAGYLEDEFSGYEYRLFGGPGIGYVFVSSERQRLQGILSLIYYRDEFSQSGKDSEEYLTGKTALKYEVKVFEDIKLKESLDYFVSFKDTDKYFIDSETAVEVKVNGAISLGMSYTVNYQNKPPSPGIRNTDTKVLTTMIIDF